MPMKDPPSWVKNDAKTYLLQDLGGTSEGQS